MPRLPTYRHGNLAPHPRPRQHAGRSTRAANAAGRTWLVRRLLMAARQLPPLQPSTRNLDLVRRRVRLWRPPFVAAMSRWVRLSVAGRERVPRRQPVLFLANHTGFFDPPIMVRAAGDPVTMLATASNFREGPLGRFFVHFGAVPKMKYTADARAIINLKRWADAGAYVGLFPEGERTWDGRPLPLAPGIEKLVRLLDVPLVTMRIYNGFRQSPRWSPRFRRGAVHVELDKPRHFDRGTPLADIRRYIEERIAVDALTAPRYPVAGSGFARGLANVAWACPQCFLIDGLREAGNRLTCEHCGGLWRVDADSRLNGRFGAATFTLPEVVDRIRSHHGGANTGAVALPPPSEPMTLLDITSGRPREVAAGALRVTASEVLIEGSETWRLPLAQVQSITVDMRRRLTFHAGKRYLEAVIARESVLKWEWFVKRLQRTT